MPLILRKSSQPEISFSFDVSGTRSGFRKAKMVPGLEKCNSLKI